MNSRTGGSLLVVHIEFYPSTCFFGYFCSDSPLFDYLDYFLAYFSQLLLCYSLHTCFPQESKAKTEVTGLIETVGVLNRRSQYQAMKDSRSSSIVSILREKQNFDKSEEAFLALKQVSTNMRDNIGKIGRNLKGIKKSEKEDTKSLLSSISTQLMYILLNSHQPLQMKMDELFFKLRDKFRNTLHPDLPTVSSRRSVCVRCGSNETPSSTPTSSCGCSHERHCDCTDFDFVPALLNHSSAKYDNRSFLIPLEGEEEIYPTTTTRKKVI